MTPLGQFPVWHPGDVPCPSQLGLLQSGVNAEKVGLGENLYVRDLILPLDVQQTA